MKRFWLVGLQLAIALSTVQAAKSDTLTFNFSDANANGSGEGISGSAQFTFSPFGSGGEYSIQSGSATILSTISGISPIETGSLITEGSYAAGTPLYLDFSTNYSISSVTPTNPNDSYMYFDNLLVSNTISPYLDENGVVFSLSTGSSSIIDGYLAFFSDGGSDYWSEYSTTTGWLTPVDFDPDAGGSPMAFGPTPEPPAMLMLGTGLFFLVGIVFRKTRSATGRVA
jgi:hypothetical protein